MWSETGKLQERRDLGFSSLQSTQMTLTRTRREWRVVIKPRQEETVTNEMLTLRAQLAPESKYKTV